MTDLTEDDYRDGKTVWDTTHPHGPQWDSLNDDQKRRVALFVRIAAEEARKQWRSRST